ncbi:MAG: asparagine synthase-related protein, partial [Isosphaeraceae bacterium]
MSRSTWTETDPMRNTQRENLVAALRSYGRVVVAFSGGIDSTVVAQAAYEALGDAAIAVTAVSDSLASGELEEAQELARRIGIRHRVVRTD